MAEDKDSAIPCIEQSGQYLQLSTHCDASLHLACIDRPILYI